MTEKYRIRPLEPRDHDAFLRLYQEAFPEKLITEKTWTRIANEPATVWLAEERDTAVGFLYFWTVADELQIIDIGTAPEHRRRGVAKALLQELLPKAEREENRVTLEARAGNSAAIALYESHGFARTGVRERYYGNGDDAILYEWPSTAPV